MTNNEYKKEYPMGTRIRFIHPRLDTNKIGKVVGYWEDDRGDGRPVIYLPTADKHKEERYPTLSDGTIFTWKCKWNEIEKFYHKNEQLLFSFMYK